MSTRAERRRKERERAKAADAKRGGGTGQPDARGEKVSERARKPRPEQVRASRVGVLAAALALLAGLIEVVVVLHLKRQGLIVRLSGHFPWMIPVAHLLAFLAVAGLLLAVRRAWPRAGTPTVTVGVLVGLMTWALVGIYEPLYAPAVALLAAGVGAQAGRMARGRFGRLLFRAAPATAAVLGVVFVGVTIYSFVAPRRAEARALAAAAPAEGPNILLIVMDAVRARSMGLYDPTLRNTPFLDALADEGVVFDRAAAPSPWTLPTHATLFTGRLPKEHDADWHRALDGRYPTIAEHLTRAGYATAGFTANLAFTGPEEGLARGFARYQAYPVNLGQIVLSTNLGRRLANLNVPRRWLGLTEQLNVVPGPEITERFLRWHDRHRDRPFFVFLNYYDAHEPFPPAPGGPPISPLHHRHSLVSGTVTHFEAPEPVRQNQFLRGYLAGYRAAIAYLDREIRRLLEELHRRGELDRTIVVVTSDHGEVIGEHRLVGHNSSLYHPNLWVPLLIRYPGSAPGGVRVPDEVTLRHLPATLLDLAGFEGETDLPGRSLARLWDGSEPDEPWQDTLYAHLSGGSDFPPWAPAARGPEMHSLIRDWRHYILNGDGTEELYDLRRDPGELRNLVTDPATGPLLEQLRQVVGSVPGVEELPDPAGPPEPFGAVPPP